MNKKLSLAAAIAAASIGVAGCDIDQTEKGEMPDIDVAGTAGDLPEYDVDVRKTQDGRMPDVDIDVEGGKLPEYEVRGPDVEIGSERKTVKVPDVDVDVSMKEKEFSVPDVDVDIPDEDAE